MRVRVAQRLFPLLQKLNKSELLQMVKQHYGNDLGLSYDEMESFQTAAETVTANHPRLTNLHAHPHVHLGCLVFMCHVCFSLSMRGEDNTGRPERPTSLRLPQGELSSYETSTPQGDNTQSSIGLQSTLSVNGVRP